MRIGREEPIRPSELDELLGVSRGGVLKPLVGRLRLRHDFEAQALLIQAVQGVYPITMDEARTFHEACSAIRRLNAGRPRARRAEMPTISKIRRLIQMIPKVELARRHGGVEAEARMRRIRDRHGLM